MTKLQIIKSIIKNKKKLELSHMGRKYKMAQLL